MGKNSSNKGEESNRVTNISVWVTSWNRKSCSGFYKETTKLSEFRLQQNKSGQSPWWRSKVISPSKEWISGAKADTQQHFLIRLFRESECISAAGHQQRTERDRTRSVMVSHCHFQRALYGATACSFEEVDKAVIVSRSSFYWPPGLLLTSVSLRSPWSSVCPVSSFKGSNASILQVWRSDLYFTFHSASTVILCLLLLFFHIN